MRNIIRFVCIFIVFASFSYSAVAEEGPEAAMKQFLAAFNAGDSEGVAAVFHEDGKLLPGGEPVVSGRSNIKIYWQAAFDAGLSHIEKTPIDVTADNNLAVETNSYVVTFDGNKIPGRETIVWKKDDIGNWMISTDMWNSGS